jgi:hypothetical protein
LYLLDAGSKKNVILDFYSFIAIAANRFFLGGNRERQHYGDFANKKKESHQTPVDSRFFVNSSQHEAKQ